MGLLLGTCRKYDDDIGKEYCMNQVLIYSPEGDFFWIIAKFCSAPHWINRVMEKWRNIFQTNLKLLLVKLGAKKNEYIDC